MKRFGIIGLGTIAKVHIKAIESLNDCKLVAICDLREGKAKKFCESYDYINGYDNIDEFLKNEQLDIVTITTPSGFHMDPTLKVIGAKINVIVEKPLEITTERCNIIIEKAKANGVVAAGVFQSRFYEASQLVKKSIENGKFGQLSICDAQVKWFRSQEYYDSGKWRGTWALDGGGALMNQGIHAIDLLLWLCGPVEEVTAYTSLISHTNIEVEDTATAILKFKNGALGVIEGTTSSYPGFLKKIDICGSKGSASIEESNLTKYQFINTTEEDKQDFKRLKEIGTCVGGATDPSLIDYKLHAKVFEDVVNAIDEGREPLITATEAKKAVELIEAIYISAREKRAVKLPL